MYGKCLICGINYSSMKQANYHFMTHDTSVPSEPADKPDEYAAMVDRWANPLGLEYDSSGENGTASRPPMNGKQGLREILEAVRKGGYYDALPEQRHPDYLDTDVAEQAIIAYLRSIVPEKKTTVNDALKFDTGYRMGWNAYHDELMKRIGEEK